MTPITIRAAHEIDEHALVRLAALDSARPLEGHATVAEVCGRIVAALGADGRVIADPFQPSAGMVELLRSHARAVARPAVLGSEGVPEPAPLRLAA